MLQGTQLVAAGLELTNALLTHRIFLVVFLNTAYVVVVLFVLLFTQGAELLGGGHVISHINVFQLAFEHLLLGLANELLHLILHAISLNHIATPKLRSVSQLEHLKLKLDSVLLEPLGVLFIVEEGWGAKLFTPPRRTMLFHGSPDSTSVWVVDDILVVV